MTHLTNLTHASVRVLSINVGRPREIGAADPWTTGIFKMPVPGPVRLSRLNLEGDGQADLRVHGGPDKALCVYSAEHFPAWRRELGVEDCGPGSFGENFSVSELRESTVSIGDTFRVGTAVVQVSQPRAPCWKLGRRWNRLDMPKLVIKSGRTGWYFRVIEPGMVDTGDALTLVERPFARWTIEAVNGVAYSAEGAMDLGAARELSECPALSAAWRDDFRAAAS